MVAVFGVLTGKSSYLGRYWSHNYQWRLYWQNRQVYNRSAGPSYSTVTYYTVISGRGAKMDFVGHKMTPKPGVRGKLSASGSGSDKTFIYTTKHGIAYKFEDQLVW